MQFGRAFGLKVLSREVFMLRWSLKYRWGMFSARLTIFFC